MSYLKLIILLLLTTQGWSVQIAPFIKVNPLDTRIVQGDYGIAGNTVMCLTKKTSGYGGTCQGMTNYASETSNRRVSKYLDIDNNASTWNSTSSYIDFPDSFDTPSINQGKGVLWAGLFWQGRITNANKYVMRYHKETATGYSTINTGKGSSYSTPSKLASTGARDIKLKIDSLPYSSITQDTFYTYGSNGITYAAYADVTEEVHSAITTSGKHTFTVANLTTNEGRESSPGVFGGWSIVVIYGEDQTGEVRNISVFNGFSSIGKKDDPFTIDGLLLPKKPHSVNSTLSLFAGEGEYRYKTDWVKLSNNDSDYSYMPNAIHNNNIFDGVFSGVKRDHIDGKFNDLQKNNNGVDVDTFDVSELVTAYRDADEDLDKMYVKWYSNQDYITPSMLVFSTQIYAPQLCYDYAIKQDGAFLPIDRATYPIAQLDGQVSSSPLEIEVFLRNEEADLSAEGIALKVDINDTIFTNDPTATFTSTTNGSTLIYRGSPTPVTPLCDYSVTNTNSYADISCTTGHDLRKGLGSLGSTEFVYSKFFLQPQNIAAIKSINQPLGLSIKYFITVAGVKLEYPDYPLGGKNVKLCEPTAGYQPTWGQFNVVETGRTTNNIYTQISRKPFDVDVIFDSSPTSTNGDHAAPISDINTTVLVEMIDLDSFGDINASCANPDSNVSQPIFVGLNFNSTNYQVQVPSQLTDYYNFATKNTAFRIWFFTDDDDILSQDWIANTSDPERLNLTSISGLYEESKYPLCSAAPANCSSDASSGDCFDCIRRNYAKALCSRDNFSVRPESYDVRLYDDNQTITNPTKIDLSTSYSYAPDSSSTPTESMQLTTDYKYRFDITATGHDSIQKVPRYTRYFNAGDDYNATLLWNSAKTGCNDTDSRDIAFYVNSGLMEKEQRSQDEIGEYLLNLKDKSWTAVDWDSTSHHVSAKNFTTGDDCIQNDTSTTTTNGGIKNGCLISTNHGADGGTPVARFYRDLNITFHPYTFDISNITPTVGLNHAAITTNNSFIYMADMSQDANMSYHLDGSIIAKSYEGNTLSNFVNNCYAQPLEISIARSDTTLRDENNNTVVYSLNFRDINSTNSVVVADSIDLNDTNVSKDFIVTTTQAHFYQALNGVMNKRLNLNFNREINVTANPKVVTFTGYSVKCTTNANCTFKANMQDNNLSAQKVLNNTITHYYGRSHSPRQKFVYPIGTAATPAVDFIYYEVFCNSNGGTSCNKALLQNGSASSTTDDPRWFVNTLHTATYGSAGTITPKSLVTGTTATGNHQDSTNLVYTGTGFPYKTTMQQSASNWLIYNKYNPAATRNDFDVEFINASGSWAGKDRANSTTNSSSSLKSNRRSMW